MPGKFDAGGTFISAHKEAGGYIITGPLERAYGGYANVRLYKLNNLVPVEVPLNGYFAKHYTAAAPSGYTYPSPYNIQYGAPSARNTRPSPNPPPPTGTKDVAAADSTPGAAASRSRSP